LCAENELLAMVPLEMQVASKDRKWAKTRKRMLALKKI